MSWVKTGVANDLLPPMLNHAAAPSDFLPRAKHRHRQGRCILASADYLHRGGSVVVTSTPHGEVVVEKVEVLVFYFHHVHPGYHFVLGTQLERPCQ